MSNFTYFDSPELFELYKSIKRLIEEQEELPEYFLESFNNFVSSITKQVRDPSNSLKKVEELMWNDTKTRY